MSSSSLLSSQLGDLTRELSYDHYNEACIKILVSMTRDFLRDMPSRRVLATDHVSAFPSLPLFRLGSLERTASLEFHAPASVDVVGSFASGTLVKVRCRIGPRKGNTTEASPCSALFCCIKWPLRLLTYPVHLFVRTISVPDSAAHAGD